MGKNAMEFRQLAEAFEKIEAESKRLELTGLLIDLLKKTPRDLVDVVLYLLQGRVYPDFMGVELGVAEKLTIRALVKSLGVKEEDVVALQRKLGDLGLAAEAVFQKRHQRTLAHEPLTVRGVYDAFVEIAKSTGPGSQERKLDRLSQLFHSASPLEGRYLVRLLGGKLRLGIADQTIQDALALQAIKHTATTVTDLSEEERARRAEARRIVEKAMSVTSDVALVAKTLYEGGLPAVKRLKMKLGVPIRPMLAERTETLEEALEKVGGTAQVEYKYDGLRVQAHVGQKKVELFSRRLENITSQFPDLVEAFERGRKKGDYIVEGEAVAVDPKTGRIRPFQELATRRGRKYGLGPGAAQGKLTSLDYTKEVPVKLFLFDALCAEGEDLTEEPLEKRRKRLSSLVHETEAVALAEVHTYSSAKDLEAYFEKVTMMGAEGVMVKNPASAYEAGARGWNWIKFKAEYQEALQDTLDLVAIGAYWGQGRRGGWYGALLLASVDEKTGRFESVSRLATGFDDATLAGLEKMFEPHVEPKQPKNVDSEEVPDVWLNPHVVLEVVGAELTLSPRHRCAWGAIKEEAGLSVRFPRFTGRWRPDKKASQATTSQELIKLYKARLKKSGGAG